MLKTEEEEEEKASTRAELVLAAERGDGVPGAHMRGRVHERGPLRRGARKRQGPVWQVRHVRGAAAADSALRHV